MLNTKNPTDIDSRFRPTKLPGERANGNTAYAQLRDRIQQRLLAELNPAATRGDTSEVRLVVERLFNETLAELGLPMSRIERNDIFDQLLADILGLGPLEALLADDMVTEILVNGPSTVFIERGGKLDLSPVKFRDNDDVMRIVERIVAPLGRRVDESSPMVDARLPDGSRVNVIIPPLSLIGPCISIRKFPKHALTPDELIKKGAMTPGIADFLRACVKAALNIVVSGGTGTGKTTILNALSSYIPEGERILTIEDAAELRLQQIHVVRLEARPANVEGKGLISIRQLVINALRMRPDRIVVGEVRGAETLDMLQAMNTGHEGSMATIHANAPREAISRLEQMIGMAGMPMTIASIRGQIASAVRMIVQLQRLSDGKRKVTSIAEITGMEGDILQMQEIYKYVRTGTAADGTVEGHFQATGVRPRFLADLVARGINIPGAYFDPAQAL